MQFDLDKCPGCQSELNTKIEHGVKSFECSSNKIFISNNLKKFINFKCFDLRIETGYSLYIKRYLSINNDDLMCLDFKNNTDNYGRRYTIIQHIISGFYSYNAKPYCAVKKPNLELMFLSNEELTNKIKAYLLLQ